MFDKENFFMKIFGQEKEGERPRAFLRNDITFYEKIFFGKFYDARQI